MPSLDPVRHRISISADDLELLRLVSAGEETAGERARVEALTRAGLITDAGTVEPLVLDLARSMVEPLLQLFVESSGSRGVTIAHVVVNGDETVWFTDPWPETAGEELVYVQDELPMLPWVIARLVGFKRATPPAGAEPITMRLVTMATLLAGLSGEQGVGWEDARSIFIAKAEEFLEELPRRHQDLAVAILATLQSTWRVSCVWGPGPEHARGLAAWYCGDGGYWVRTDPREPLLPEQVTEDAMATFAPMTGGEVWEGLIDLIPGKDELRAGVAAAATLAGASS